MKHGLLQVLKCDPVGIFLILIDQLIDRTRGRKATFFEDGIVAHIMFADPITQELADPLAAAAHGLAFFGLAGELAGKTAKGPGSFMTAILDALYQITPDDVVDGCRISEG